MKIICTERQAVLASALLSLAFLAPTSIAGDILGSNTIVALDPESGGLIQIDSVVHDLGGGEALYEYHVLNLSFDPNTPFTNGLSGLHLSWGLLPGPFAEDGFAPDGWTVTLEEVKGGIFEANFEIPFMDGAGLGFGESGLFGFISGRRFSDDPLFPSHGNSHTLDGPTNEFLLVDIETGRGPLRPVPAPGSLTLLFGGALTLVSSRRRRRSVLREPS